MKNNLISWKIAISTAAVLFFMGCTNHGNKQTSSVNPDSTYFSLHQFAKDQFETYYGQPFVLTRIVTLDGRTDSAMVNFGTMDWGAILNTFFEADISNPKFLGHYKFESFDNDIMDSHSYVYDAKDPKLFTRTLQINVDPVTHKIKSIYIETAQNTTWHQRSQRLLYMPLKVIQIQEEEHTTPGPTRRLRVEYQF